MILAFGDIEVDPAKGEVRKDGTPIHVAARAMSLLYLLANNASRIVTKDEIIERIWDGRAITDAAISTVVKEARKAIGDDGARQEVIKTIHGQGFRCVADVRILGQALIAASEMPVEPQGTISELGRQGKPSIAVLPFGAFGATDFRDQMGDAIAADLIAALSRLRWVTVTARGSSFRFRQADPDFASIQSLLGVRYVLSGLIDRADPHIGVTVELARTHDGTVIWSDTFSGTVDQVHQIRSDIIGAAIAAMELHVPLSEAEAARIASPENLDAWAEYHIGLQHLYRFNRRDNDIAQERFKRAILQEPGFARAHAGLSFSAFQSAFMSYSDDSDIKKIIESATASAEKSLELDMLDPFGNYCMGRSRWIAGDVEGMQSWMGRSLEISPNFAQGHYGHALSTMLLSEGDQAIAKNQKAMMLSPLDPLHYAMLGVECMSHIAEGRHEEAAVWGDRGARAPGAHYYMSMIAAVSNDLNGNADAAKKWARDAKRRRPDANTQQFFQAFPFATPDQRGKFEQSLKSLGF